MTVEVQEPQAADLEQYRGELTGYCYRMLGSSYDADDAVQETLVRAWQALDRFEGRSSLRSWLYRIATNVCLDSLRAGQRRALQRARATVAQLDAGGALTSAALGEQESALLARYVSAFERYDIDAFVQLLHEDASMSMPPLALWLRGREDLRGWYLGHGAECAGSRLLPVAVNGQPGFAQYRPSAAGGHEPWAVQVLELSGGRIVHIHAFLGEPVFARLGLPLRLP